MTYRTGRKVGRTIYHQVGAEPSDDDELVGLMDTPVLAALFVMAMNNLRANPDQAYIADALKKQAHDALKKAVPE